MAEKTPRLGWAAPAVGAAPGTLSPGIVTIWSRIGVARGIGVAEGRGVGFSTTVTWLGDGDGAGTDGLGFAGGAGSVWCGDGATATVFGAGVVTLGSGTVTLGGVGLATTGAGGAAPVPMKSSVTQTVPSEESTTPTPTVVNAGSRMFFLCSGEFMNAWAMDSQVGPTPTFSPTVCQLDGTRFAMLVLWKMWPAVAMVCDQTREIRSRSPWMERGATPAAVRAELMAEAKQDSSSAGDAEAGRRLCSATAAMVPAIIRLRTARGCFKLASFGGLAAFRELGGRSMTLRPRVAPGLPFSYRPWDQDPRVLHQVHRHATPGAPWPAGIKPAAGGGPSLGDATPGGTCKRPGRRSPLPGRELPAAKEIFTWRRRRRGP